MSADTTRVAAAIRSRAEAVTAPPALHERIASQRTRARGASSRLVAAAALASAVAAVAAALALWLPAAGTGDPSVADAAAAALLAPTQPAPPAQPAAPALLAVSAGSISFPDYGEGWRALGVRRGQTGDRDIVTVSYGGARGATVGYSIVEAPALALPDRVRTVVRGGARFVVLSAHGATVVTWRRAGQTCVLASRDVSAAQLVRLAVWKAPVAQTSRYEAGAPR